MSSRGIPVRTVAIAAKEIPVHAQPGEYTFAVGDAVAWADNAPASSKRLYGDGPFTVSRVEPVVLRCTCGSHTETHLISCSLNAVPLCHQRVWVRNAQANENGKPIGGWVFKPVAH